MLSGQILGQITIPIYQGGAEYATTRQAKESLSQQEIQTDSLRNQVRQAVVAAWGLNQAAVGVVRAARAAVSANEVALTGVREEAKVGQRTTLDVLNAQQALLQARTTLVQAEHDQVVDFVSAAVGDRPAQYPDPRTFGRRIRSAGAFRSGQEQVDRPQDAERTVSALASAACRRRSQATIVQADRRSIDGRRQRRLSLTLAIGDRTRLPGLEQGGLMSAINSNSSDRDLEAIHRAQRAHEPSMEEILASIRNIIAR